MPPRIDHVIVLMMENRSFDHMLGFLDHPKKAEFGLTGNETIGTAKVASNAYYEIQSPDHSHAGVMGQLFGGESYDRGWKASRPYPTKDTNRGFVQSFVHSYGERVQPGAVLRCFHPKLIPVISGLAKDYAICTRWFCSVPGETWPNRDFAVAARSFGKANQSYSLRTTTDTIFHRLSAAKQSWRIYHDAVAQTLLYSGLYKARRWSGMARFFDDVKHDTLPRYSFIEPDYGIGSTHWAARFLGITKAFGDTYGNSQHPSQARSEAEFLAGEYLMAGIYNALLATMTAKPGEEAKSLFARTLFLITYDEHGGFYDRMRPPDAPQPTPSDVTEDGFRFDVLGPRVPAIVISPWIAKGTIEKAPFDHSSIPATVRKLFAPDQPPLTARDAHANTFDRVLGNTLRTPTSADPLRPMKPLDRVGAEEMAERFAASPNPADRLGPDGKLRDEWLWLLKKANDGMSLVPTNLETIGDDDELARQIVDRLHETSNEPDPL